MFKNKNMEKGITMLLRMKENETSEEAIDRLTKDGWLIFGDDLLVIKDLTGKCLIHKRDLDAINSKRGTEKKIDILETLKEQELDKKAGYTPQTHPKRQYTPEWNAEQQEHETAYTGYREHKDKPEFKRFFRPRREVKEVTAEGIYEENKLKQKSTDPKVEELEDLI